uniref:Uncharacterized protein n=1 Tax=Romanomermis culicivorax TaxID=13658 RepID=A0A915KWH6_ROMCU
MKIWCIFFYIVAQILNFGLPACYPKCHCPKEDEAVCYLDSSETVIPDALPDYLRSLIIRGGTFENFNRHYLATFPRLETLSLISTFIRRLAPYSFNHLDNLKNLYLKYNLIETLGPNAFGDLKRLRSLELPDNGIEVIEGWAFNGSGQIQELELRFNPIKIIKSNAFSNMKDISYLKFPHNVTEIEPKAFDGLIDVHFLDMHNWPAAKSRVGGIRSGTFYGLSHVTSFLISNSDLGIVYPHAFDHAYNIGTMAITMCRILLLDKRSFLNVRNLKYLEFERNEIQKMNKFFASQFFDNKTDLYRTEVKFSKNRFSCDCTNMKVLYTLSKKFGEQLLDENFCIMSGEVTLNVVLDDLKQNCTNHFEIEDIDNEATISLRNQCLILMISTLISLYLVFIL